MPSWARLIRRVYEVDPLLCSFCGAEMKILAFIVDFGAAKATAKSLKLPAQEPEPLAHAPPEALELIAESACVVAYWLHLRWGTRTAHRPQR